MAGQIKSMIDTIIEKRSHGNSTIATAMKTKFILRGIDPDRFDRTSPDDPALVAKIRGIGAELGVGI